MDMIKGFSETLSSGLGSKGKDIKGLLSGSFALLGKDADIFNLAFRMTLLKIIKTSMFLACMYCFFISGNYLTGMLLVIFILFSGPLFSFFQMRYKAIGTWMIYDILKGKDTDIGRGVRAVQGMGITLFLYSFVDYLIKSKDTEDSSDDSNTNTGFFGFFINIFFDIFSEVWDLVKNFSMPAIVIDKSTIKQIPQKLSLLKKNIPGALVGILGIDMIGSLVLSLFCMLTLPAFALGAGLGYLGQSVFPENWLITLPLEQEVSINTLPIFIFMFIGSILSSFLTSIVEIVKTSYFTTFYMALTRPDEIHGELQSRVTHYLDYDGKLDDYTFFKKQTPKDEKGYELNQKTGDDQKIIIKLADTFKLNIEKGMTKGRIYQALIKKGYSEKQLDIAFKSYQYNIRRKKA